MLPGCVTTKWKLMVIGHAAISRATKKCFLLAVGVSDLSAVDRATLAVMNNVCVLSVSLKSRTDSTLKKKNVWRCRKFQATLITNL